MATKTKLTNKQEKFVLNLVKGMSQRQAYVEAYPTAKKWKNYVSGNKAYALTKNPKIQERYRELMKRTEDKAIITAKEMQMMYSDILRGDKKFKDTIIIEGKVQEIDVPTKLSDWNKTSELLMRLQGNYTEKVEVKDTTPKWFKKN